MRHLFPAVAALAALLSAPAAIAGPGCGGRGHDVTANAAPGPGAKAGQPPAEMAAAAPEDTARSPAAWADVLAFLDATAPRAQLTEPGSLSR
ncbi:hypothetical protein [Limimaricola hongkongensis]|uniref:Uncharacterized protein n=1 Tax=Limimaricola hongkongensis DSM 17492 TaxID=1122180 RepID=A0A017H903_9RHOB|nr:hypothetical protein [Limimaricola hongkongensis]EYD70603.1 hypothetical protein Lokhon_02243 [Limimaricola hongkongensis DSM 17492]